VKCDFFIAFREFASRPIGAKPHLQFPDSSPAGPPVIMTRTNQQYGALDESDRRKRLHVYNRTIIE
jgi:hypothetical protein